VAQRRESQTAHRLSESCAVPLYGAAKWGRIQNDARRFLNYCSPRYEERVPTAPVLDSECVNFVIGETGADLKKVEKIAETAGVSLIIPRKAWSYHWNLAVDGELSVQDEGASDEILRRALLEDLEG
jgi:hypothetical protein